MSTDKSVEMDDWIFNSISELKRNIYLSIIHISIYSTYLHVRMKIDDEMMIMISIYVARKWMFGRRFGSGVSEGTAEPGGFLQHDRNGHRMRRNGHPPPRYRLD